MDLALREIEIHGQRVRYRTAGPTGVDADAPVLLLVHGMAGSSETWLPVMPALAQRLTVVAPDLLGHGQSDKPAGDYSLGAFACLLRDLLVALGHESVTIAGQSLGGGVAMQFAYQHPERCERLVLVASGGLGREVSPLLRLLSLPGSEAVLRLACATSVQNVLGSAGDVLGRAAARAGLHPAPFIAEMWRSYASLGDDATRRAFLRTLRAVVEPRGQAVSARNRLHLAEELPTLLVWGDADPIIPVEHALAAHRAIGGSRLEIFEGVRHFPHCEAPGRFVDVLADFVEGTVPARVRVSSRHVVGRAEPHPGADARGPQPAAARP